MLDATILIKSLKNQLNGLTISDWLRKHPSFSRRTIQRGLAQLVSSGLIRAEGKGRARRYFPVEKNAEQDIFPVSIPLSPDSLEILAYVDQPISARKPIGYQLEFLKAYQPNKTFYLPLPLRSRLRKMGDLGQERKSGATYDRQLLARLLIDLSWASSHLEGNTYSLLDTKELIEHGKVAKGKNALETQMILNHKTAIELLVNNKDMIQFNRYTFLNLHSALSENLLANSSDEGRLRHHSVEIGKSVFRPLSIPQQIEEMFELILTKVSQIKDPFEQAFFLMVHIPYLQPFIDINKRTSRLAANISLIQQNLCPLTFIGVTEQAYTRAMLGVYELTRVELLRDLFVWAYERSTQEYMVTKKELAEPDPLRLKYREIMKQVVHDVVIQSNKDPMQLITSAVEQEIDNADRKSVQALLIDELRRLHEGVLARYQLRLSEFQSWKEKQTSL